MICEQELLAAYKAMNEARQKHPGAELSYDAHKNMVVAQYFYETEYGVF